MNQHCSCCLLECPDPSLCFAILVVCIHASKGKTLSFLSATAYPCVCSEDAIVGMIVLDAHTMGASIMFESKFAFKCFLHICCLLEVDKAEVQELVHIDCGILVSLCCELTGELGNEPWCWRDHLVN